MAHLIIIQVAVVLVGLSIYQLFLRRKNNLPLPPGPRGLPILGNIRDLPAPGQPEYEHWLKFKDIYGPLSSITIAGRPIVLIHDRQIAFDLLEKASLKTSNRPSQPFANDLCGFGVYLATLQYGPAFQHHRKLVHQMLGTKRRAEQFNDVQDVESRRFLLRVMNKPKEAITHIKTEAAAIILQVVYGYSIEPLKEDPLVALVERMMYNLSLAFVPLSWVVDVIPALNYLPEGLPFTGFKKTGRQWKRVNEIATDAPYTIVRKRMEEGTQRTSYVSSLVDNFSHVDKGGLSQENEDAIKLTATVMYGGGADTSVSNLSSFILAMMMFPKVQKKAQREIDAVVGTDRLPGFGEGVLPLVPGQGSYLLASIWWFLHDPQFHPNPSIFDPERFLEPRNEPDPSGSAFGYGRRICPGRFLAMENLFITMSRFLAAFDISKAIDGDGREIEPEIRATSGLVSHPIEFSYNIKPRSAKHAELIQAVEVLHPWEKGDARLLDPELMKESEE